MKFDWKTIKLSFHDKMTKESNHQMRILKCILNNIWANHDQKNLETPKESLLKG